VPRFLRPEPPSPSVKVEYPASVSYAHHGAGDKASETVFTIEVTRGASWDRPAETINCRECATDSIDAAIAEALHWLVKTQEIAAGRGATHYRVIRQDGTVIGGPP
jgi:hypothetical protein